MVFAGFYFSRNFRVSHFRIFSFTHFREEMRNFSKKIAKCEQKFRIFSRKVSFAGNPNCITIISNLIGKFFRTMGMFLALFKKIKTGFFDLHKESLDFQTQLGSQVCV